jgi:hypothetical protein
MSWRWLNRLVRNAPLVPAHTKWACFEPLGVAFSVLDLDARFAFRTATSISFSIEWNGHDDDLMFRKGWIDVHYPCQGEFAGHVKAVIRVAVSPPYHDFQSQKAIIEVILHALGIPEDETYEAHFFAPTEEFEIVQPVDREGRTGGFFQELPNPSEGNGGMSHVIRPTEERQI